MENTLYFARENTDKTQQNEMSQKEITPA